MQQRPAAPPSLKDADWLKRPQVRHVFAALNKDGVTTRAVGGAVRNTLLGLPVAEIDLATTALPERVMTLARKAGLKAVPTGIEHGTVTVIADGIPFEVTTLRRDIETYGRHATVAFTQNWQEDARRRDFTLNALYAASDGTVFDPLGGYGDLIERRVRFIGDPSARIEEDYLRILRFFRFNAYYGKGPLDADGLAACVRLRADLEQLSAERVAGELKRILVAPQAVRAIETLFDYGLLTALLGGVPRLMRFARLVGAEEALGLAPDAALRLAALAVFCRRMPSGLPRACACRTPSRLCCCLARPITTRSSFPTRLPRGARSIGSVRASSRRMSCSPRPMKALLQTIACGGRRFALPTAGRAGVSGARARHHGARQSARPRDR